MARIHACRAVSGTLAKMPVAVLISAPVYRILVYDVRVSQAGLWPALVLSVPAACQLLACSPMVYLIQTRSMVVMH